MEDKTLSDVSKFNPYHDSRGRFASADSATSFTYAPGKSDAHDKAIQRGKDGAEAEKGFKGTLYHGSPSTDIDEFDIGRAGSNTSSGEKLIYLTDSKQMAEDFSYERLDGSTMFTQQRGKKGRVYEVDVEMKNPLDFRNLTDADIDNIIKLDTEGLLTPDLVRSLSSNHQLLKASLNLSAESLKSLGYDGLIANTGKAGHGSLEYAVVDSKQARIKKSVEDVRKFNPYHDSRGRFTSANAATSFTIRTIDPSKQSLADRAADREKERQAGGSATDTENESPRMQSVHQIEDKIRDQFYETAAVVDKDGQVLFQKDGSMSQVSFNKAECEMMRGNTLTHNHPRSSIFSVEDTFMFVNYDMEEMRATTREGNTYSIKRGAGYTENKGMMFVVNYEGEMKSARRIAQRDLDNRGFRELIMDGKITQQQANQEFGKVMSKEMENWSSTHASKYGIDFSVEHRDVTPSYNVAVNTTKSADDESGIVLDQATNDLDDAAFNEWLNGEQPMEKSAPTDTVCNIMKTDDDKRLVFGWASVSLTIDGVQLEDRQKDIIDPEDLEEAAYEYVLNFRDTGEEHIKTMRKKGKLVESCVFTAEKQKAMGIPEGILPVGWWIGFKIEDDAAWDKVKTGVYKMFSIEGRANRVPVEKADKPTGCGVLVVRDGKVLTGTRKERSSHGEICGPGGHIEEGETPEAAAVREAQEEFGITCRNLVPLGTLDGGEKYGISAVFLCTEFEGEPHADEDEMTGAMFVAPKDIAEDKMFLPFKQSLSLLPEEVTAEPRTVGKSDMTEGELENTKGGILSMDLSKSNPDRYDTIVEVFP